jgi:hypothetical protein
MKQTMSTQRQRTERSYFMCESMSWKTATKEKGTLKEKKSGEIHLQSK